MSEKNFIPLPARPRRSDAEMNRHAEAFRDALASRRSVRSFSSDPVPRQVVENCLRAALTAPSGANLQPWHFVLVGDPETKKEIREAAEAEEREFYSHRAPEDWLSALEPLGTDAKKPFLEIAPWLIAIFVQKSGTGPDGEKIKHYYPMESVGLATGMLITALHLSGLATLTHTPSPMKFLNRILKRPTQEKPFLLLVVGYPAEGTVVPDISRRPFSESVSVVD